MNLLIVIVNYRTAAMVVDCLRSLEPELAGLAGARVVVTDNASGDDSVQCLKRAVVDQGWGDWVTIQPLDRNGGFAAGNNAAIRPALASAEPPEFVLLLNPDTIVRPGAIATLVGFLKAHPEVGLAGARLEEPDGSPQVSAFRFPTVLGELENGFRFGPLSRLLRRWIVARPIPSEAVPTDWVSGACLLVRRAVLERVGLLDEGYFMYFEEVDFCRRARQAGWPCWHVPEARVVHLVGQSSGFADPKRPRRRRPTYWFAARRRYLRTHLGRTRTLLADLGWSLGYATYRLRRPLRGKPDTDPPCLLRDFLRYNLLPVPTRR